MNLFRESAVAGVEADFRAPAVGWLALLLARLTAWRHARTRPWGVLALIGLIAVGVASVLSVRLANQAALAGFQDFAGVLTSECDWTLAPAVGTLDERWLIDLRRALGSRPVQIVPVVETTVASLRAGGADRIGDRETYTLLGMDLVAIAHAAGQGRWMRGAIDARLAAEGSLAVGRDPRAIWISESLSKSLDLRVGVAFPLIVQDRLESMRVAGVLPEVSGRPGLPRQCLLMDLSAAQALTGKAGRLDRVELTVESGPERATRRAAVGGIAEVLGRGRWIVSSSTDRRDAAETMTRAFRFNLTLLSWIAFTVGAFLVWQALDGAVLRRRSEIAILVALGVSRAAIQAAWLVESGSLGLIGGLIGGPLGWLWSLLAARLVGRTVNALYFPTGPARAVFPWAEMMLGVTIAVVASVVAGWLPARRAAATPPAQWLGRESDSPTRSRPRREIGLAAGCAALAAMAAQCAPLRFEGGFRLALGGYLALAGWAASGAVLAGAALRALGIGARAEWLGATGRMAFSYLRFPTARHRLAVAGLSTAVGMTSGMAILVASFDQTMQRWIGSAFQADLYLASAGAQGASSKNRLRPETWRSLQRDEVVAEALVSQVVSLTTPQGSAALVGADLSGIMRRRSMLWLSPPPAALAVGPWPDTLAVVSESFAAHFRLRVGASYSIPTPGGPWRVEVCGVYADYGNDRGSITVDRAALSRKLGDDSAVAMTVFLRRGIAPEAVRARWLQTYPALRIYPQASLRREILRVFRETFAITDALEVLGVAVALVGLALTLACVFESRHTDRTTLRAVGMLRREIVAAATLEGIALAAVGAIAGAAAGVAMGRTLVFVVNRQTFGWTLSFRCPAANLSALILAVVATGAVVSAGVGWRTAAERVEPED